MNHTYKLNQCPLTSCHHEVISPWDKNKKQLVFILGIIVILAGLYVSFHKTIDSHTTVFIPSKEFALGVVGGTTLIQIGMIWRRWSGGNQTQTCRKRGLLSPEANAYLQNEIAKAKVINAYRVPGDRSHAKHINVTDIIHIGNNENYLKILQKIEKLCSAEPKPKISKWQWSVLVATLCTLVVLMVLDKTNKIFNRSFLNFKGIYGASALASLVVLIQITIIVKEKLQIEKDKERFNHQEIREILHAFVTHHQPMSKNTQDTQTEAIEYALQNLFQNICPNAAAPLASHSLVEEIN